MLTSLLEHRLTFKPDRTDHGGLSSLNHNRMIFGLEFGLALDGVWFNRGSEAVVLFMHGNRHNITKFREHYALFHNLGISCFAFDYPGYGKSAGSPSEVALYASARAAISHLTSTLGVSDTKRIVLYGCSLGGAVAVQLASSQDIGGLITESTFTNSHEIGAYIYPYLPITRFLKRRFINDSLVRRITAPKLFLHGSADKRVPVNMAYALHAAAIGEKILIVVPEADHTSCLEVGGDQLKAQIGEFIKLACIRGAQINDYSFAHIGLAPFKDEGML
jgi:pimeloyl-ACP methyl ester carboxylesterase